jgi:predicted enzyme related to lactoylglutathione lyase
MQNHVHHAHLFASNLGDTLKFYQEMFGGKILADLNMAGARNVFLAIGQGGFISTTSRRRMKDEGPSTTSGFRPMTWQGSSHI